MFDEPATDVRENLWNLARAQATGRAPQKKLMQLASWLWYTRGLHELPVIAEILQRAAHAANPRAYFQPDGAAVQRLISTVARDRAERERDRIREEERKSVFKLR